MFGITSGHALTPKVVWKLAEFCFRIVL